MAYTFIVVGIVLIASGVFLLKKRNTGNLYGSFENEGNYSTNQNLVLEDQAGYNKQKGNAFEEYVVLKFDKNYFKLLDWRSDKSIGKIHPESNQYPDLKFQYNHDRQIDSFAVECKWRKDYYRNAIEWATDYQLNNYRKYSSNLNISVFIVIGVGGLPNKPNFLYVAPLNKLVAGKLTKEELKPYLKDIRRNFFWDIQEKSLR